MKDIVNLFADSGIGHDSMGIISQNKMDEILNARPEEKRLFFEEAAGISKYRSRKKEAMRKLEDTENNLQRVHDILGEIENQLEPLAEGAAKAKRYQELQEKQADLQLTGLYQHYQRLQARRGEFDQQLQEKKDQELAANTAKQLIESRSAQLDGELLNLEKNLEQLAQKRQEIHTSLEEADSRIKVLEERRRQGKANRQRHQQQIRQQQAAMAEAGEGVAGLEQAEKSAQSKKQAVEQEIAVKRQRAKELRQSLTELRQQGQGLTQQKLKIHAVLQSAEGRMQVLERLQSSYEGFGRAVKAVLKNQQPWKAGICGAVAELLDVPGKYVLAIETALGGSLQNIVTKDTDTAKAAIAMLKADKLGRATFLPLSSIVVRQNREQLPAQAKGIIGWAHQVVQVDNAYSKVAEFLLGRNEENHLISPLHGQFSAFVREATALVDGTDADGILHIVVIETGIPKQAVSAISHHSACRDRIRRIGEHEILLALTGSLIADSHHISWVRDEILTLISYAILDEGNRSQS